MSRRNHDKAIPSISTVHDEESKIDLIVMPGILNHSDDWLEPVLPAMSEGRNVHSVLYGNGNFDREATERLVEEETVRLLKMGHRVIYLGSSLGGNLAPFVAERVKERLDDGDPNIGALLLDAPYGAETFYPLPAAVRGFMDNHPPTWQPGRIARAIGNRTIMKLMTLPSSLPKAHETSYPKNPAERSLLMNLAYPDGAPHEYEVDDKELFDAITVIARNVLSGNDFGAYVTQLEYMIGVAKDGQLDKAIRNGLDGLASYVMASKNNATVVQPLAMKKWLEVKPDMKHLEVEGPHVATTQMMPEWSEAIRAGLKDVS